MSGEKLEGTLLLDGLIQGRVPGDGDTAAKLEQWVQFMAGFGLRFNLEIRNATFSLLPDNHAVSVARLGGMPEQTLQQAIEQLADVFTGPERSALFSTVRSYEYRKGEEVQTIYTMVDGKLRPQSRTVPADTVAPPEPISTKERFKLGAMGLAFAVVFLGVALLVPGVREMFGQVADAVKPFDAKEVTLELGPYAEFLTCTIDEKQSDRTVLLLQFKRTPQYPTSEAAFHQQVVASAALPRRLALENLARGYVRIEMFDAAGKYLGTDTVRLAELRSHPDYQLKLLQPQKVRVARYAFAL